MIRGVLAAVIIGWWLILSGCGAKESRGPLVGFDVGAGVSIQLGAIDHDASECATYIPPAMVDSQTACFAAHDAEQALSCPGCVPDHTRMCDDVKGEIRRSVFRECMAAIRSGAGLWADECPRSWSE